MIRQSPHPHLIKLHRQLVSFRLGKGVDDPGLLLESGGHPVVHLLDGLGLALADDSVVEVGAAEAANEWKARFVEGCKVDKREDRAEE